MNELWCPFMYCGTCPYCGKVFKDSIEEVVKTQLVNHMIREHYDELLMDGMVTEYCQTFGEKTCAKWVAGRKARSSIRPC